MTITSFLGICTSGAGPPGLELGRPIDKSLGLGLVLVTGNIIPNVAKTNFFTGKGFLQGCRVVRFIAGTTLGFPLSGKMASSPSLLLKILSETWVLGRMRRIRRMRLPRLAWREKLLWMLRSQDQRKSVPMLISTARRSEIIYSGRRGSFLFGAGSGVPF